MLSILIPTVIDRQTIFSQLHNELLQQAAPFGDSIEVLFLTDDRSMSIGEKRNKLYSMASKKYSVQWDDDDWIHPRGIEILMSALHEDIDCITYKWFCYFNPVIEHRVFNCKYTEVKDNVDGYNKVGPPSPKCVIKTDLARKVKFPNIRFGEDGHFEKEIQQHIKTSTHIDDFIYYYMDRCNEGRGPERYGLKEFPKGIN